MSFQSGKPVVLIILKRHYIDDHPYTDGQKPSDEKVLQTSEVLPVTVTKKN